MNSSKPVVTTQPGPYLVLQTESGSRHLSLIGSNCWTIGRSDDNNFVLPDRWISRNHAMLQCMETGEFYLIDLGSRNGSFVNGRRVSVPVTLHNGDALTFGQTELKFYCPAVEPQQTSGINSIDSQDFTATATLNVRRLISVMVVDIRDFTVMTRQLDEKVLSEVIGTWFRCAGEIIGEYGSWVDKYIGDAVMAVWIHGTQGVSPEEMVQIARAISALHTMTSRLHERYPLPFPIRIGAGLNTGYAMVGNTGTGARPDYTALGDTVNAAFRFESSTKQLGLDIAIGETTYNYLANLGASEQIFKRYTVNMKGYDDPIQTHAGTFSDLDRFLNLHSKALS
ncbi:MAG: adenylate/guanylate cyclase domain-containing protein [Leptolyngbyaceae cyanobacterium SM1_1_3]|nr:adenylate/guanylate cyclase domain-containing protein [Leptolyngbyaceae cyanobacterium SM1_1_3]NJO10351.1 adenylate/guanylate cyclase domain-containing protein [Leptolyngbyaceae cyanobacterium SL_1_1]